MPQRKTEQVDAERSRGDYLATKRGDLTAYAGMVGEEFASKLDRLSQIIGSAHEPSVGRYKESLLINCLRELIPRRYSVGTGFVAFVKDSPLRQRAGKNLDLMNLKEYYVSRQLDIIVFDDYNFAPIFRDGDLVVIAPQAVKAVVEVKGYLTCPLVADSVRGFLDFGRKWKMYSDWVSRRGQKRLRNPSLNLIAWDVYVPSSGKPACDGKRLRRTIVETYRSELSSSELKTPSIPLLGRASIYKDCIVSYCSYFVDGVRGRGYTTERGQLVRYADDRAPFLAGDATISSLLASILVSLDTPFTPEFVYVDQSMTASILPHKFRGITDLVTGEDVRGA